MTSVPPGILGVVAEYRALATDYDGTIASTGAVAEATVAALLAAREAGLRLILVTGRELIDLFHTFRQHTVFDFIVAENGAVLHDTVACRTEAIAPAPPAALLDALTKHDIPFSTGRSIIATSEPYAQAIRAAIHDAGVSWEVILNKGSVMALPPGVTKASGLAAALNRLGLGPEQTIGVGDAENDEVLMRHCGMAVAVANALPRLKSIAHIVTIQPNGAGVQELIGMIVSKRFNR